METNDYSFAEMAGLSFVVLHYLNKSITEECVDILLQYFPSYPIVIVDNASPNNSGIALQQKYQDKRNVFVIINKENVGFAKGNNIGCKFAKQFGTQFTVVMNSDIIINDPDFLQKLKTIYSETHFSVFGPDIVTISGYHQNPRSLSSSFCEKEYLLATITKLEKKISTLRMVYYKDFFIYSIKRIAKKILNIKPSRKYTDKRIINPVLFGACLVFTKEYINNHEDVFYPGTFMYFEEDILWYQCQQRHETLVYDNSICVLHKEGQSVASLSKNSYLKKKFKLENILKSAKVYLELLEKNQK